MKNKEFEGLSQHFADCMWETLEIQYPHVTRMNRRERKQKEIQMLDEVMAIFNSMHADEIKRSENDAIPVYLREAAAVRVVVMARLLETAENFKVSVEASR